MNSETYKYATMVLAIVVVILGWMLLQRTPAAEGIGDAAQNIEDCSAALASWTAENKTVANASESARADLDLIVRDCQRKIGSAE